MCGTIASASRVSRAPIFGLPLRHTKTMSSLNAGAVRHPGIID